ncbi:RHS repeat-associated core domain-containing protein [Aliiroseovarius halocynthiae]|uniref:RHS repeat-associated core domain-containing protein n=1 Tax=Aliiroseovarius halocynthiae TaxID=985055 RepID=A0A545SLD0_9RHOB|nr:RHS repeat-associated core domain-containing protein [Aliiroseovarius halocynthiae]SMR83555.1 RHS repeat-associated core domain-containing protein [Aliiroseovarius halocynthiae]
MEGTPVAVIENGTLYFVRTDHIGRPVFATNSAGVSMWQASYLPFGGVHTTTGDPILLRFPGQWFQSESGLHQNWMRDYDPTTGRYLQADPLGLVDGASVYGYALQNPGRYIDPRGEQGIALGGGLGGGVGTGGGVLGGPKSLPNWGDPVRPLTPIELLLLLLGATMNTMCESCPPCKPYPVGDIGYIGPEVHQRGRDAGTYHYHIYEVQQKPHNCECFWREATKRHTGNHHSYVPIGHNLNGNGRPPSYP